MKWQLLDIIVFLEVVYIGIYGLENSISPIPHISLVPFPFTAFQLGETVDVLHPHYEFDLLGLGLGGGASEHEDVCHHTLESGCRSHRHCGL